MTPPKHLEPLLDGTPMSFELIKHAWPGLSTSDRAYLLAALLDPHHNFRIRFNWPDGDSWEHFMHNWPNDSQEYLAPSWPSDNRNQLIDLALEDENAYIRYLAAKHVLTPLQYYENEENENNDSAGYLVELARFKKIESDSVALVRSAPKWGPVYDVETFWAQPQVVRLASTEHLSWGEIAGLLRYAVKNLLPNNAVNLREVIAVLHQYFSFSHYGEYEKAELLWEVVPETPKEITDVLLTFIPEGNGLESAIICNAIESLDEGQLEYLLCRSDIKFHDLRRKLYEESSSQRLRCAALNSQHFHLKDSDISTLVHSIDASTESGEKRAEEWDMLARYCLGATLVQMAAICNLCGLIPDRYFEARTKNLERHELEREIFSLGLFRFAHAITPAKASDIPGWRLTEKLQRRGSIVAPGNPWQTYLNLEKFVWPNNLEEYIGHLARSVFWEDAEAILHRRSLDILQSVQKYTKDISTQNRAELSALSDALSALSKQLVSIEEATGKRFEAFSKSFIPLGQLVMLLLSFSVATILLLLFR